MIFNDTRCSKTKDQTLEQTRRVTLAYGLENKSFIQIYDTILQRPTRMTRAYDKYEHNNYKRGVMCNKPCVFFFFFSSQVPIGRNFEPVVRTRGRTVRGVWNGFLGSIIFAKPAAAKINKPGGQRGSRQHYQN